MTFLGFVLNSVTVTVQLTTERKDKLKNGCQNLVEMETCTIQNLAEVTGLLMSNLQEVECGPLHYRNLDRNKTYASREHKGNFGASMTLFSEARSELHWRLANVDRSFKYISHREPVCCIQTDTSTDGWGGVRRDQKTGERWTPEEAAHRINYLELLAVNLTLKPIVFGLCNLTISGPM